MYQLTAPKAISIKFEDMHAEGRAIVQPEYMSICHADQRYFQGLRPPHILSKKLPMALIHECCGIVVSDPSGTYGKGAPVVLVPNQPAVEEPGNDIYENYRPGSFFMSSGYDGFMQEIVPMPAERILPVGDIDLKTACIAEFVSVAAHAIERFKRASHIYRDEIAVWGDGSLSYVLCILLRLLAPQARICVIGLHEHKLSLFSFVDEVYISGSLPKGFSFDHAFECAGGEGSVYAIDEMISAIRPQGTIMLLGVSENKVPIMTRDVLEKGISLVGCSRSGRADFEQALEAMKNPKTQAMLSRILEYAGDAEKISDIHTIFQADSANPFKTVFRWRM